jgi:MFS family permease
MNFKTYSAQFWLLCLSSFFFFGSFNMILPELPDFLTNLGGADYKGLILSFFTLTAMISRPFSGKLADKVGRIPVMIFGSVVCVISSLIYPALTSIYGFFILRFFHGFSTGFTPTGFTAYIADIVPVERRGEAMGLLSTFGTLGMSASPAIGGWISYQYSLDVMFYCSSLFGFIAVMIFAGVKETLTSKEQFHRNHLKIKKEDLFEKRVLVPCVIMVLSSFSFGTIVTLVPDLSNSLGMTNKGAVFTGFSLASVAVRIAAGKVSDKYGRRSVLYFSTLLIATAMIVIGLATKQWMLWTGGVLYGMAYGMNSPTLFAWVTDLSDENNKGRAFGSIYISLEFGIMFGALVSGFLFAWQPANFILPFGTAALIAGLSFVYLMLSKSK